MLILQRRRGGDGYRCEVKRTLTVFESSNVSKMVGIYQELERAFLRPRRVWSVLLALLYQCNLFLLKACLFASQPILTSSLGLFHLQMLATAEVQWPATQHRRHPLTLHQQ